MNEQIANKQKIIDLINKFVTFKETNICCLNQKISQIKKINLLKKETSTTNDYVVEIYFYLEQKWADNDFALFKNNLILINQNLKSLILTPVSLTQNQEYQLVINQEDLDDLSLVEEKGKNKLYRLQGKIENVGAIDFLVKQKYLLFKRDINEYIQVNFLKNISNNLINNQVVSANVQNILLGLKQISKYHYQDHDSPYDKELDKYQKQAFNFALSNNSLLIIKGPPGTGKSRLITSLIKHFVYQEKAKVILASTTHAALDNVISKVSMAYHKEGNYSGLIWRKSSKNLANPQYFNWRLMLNQNIKYQIEKNLDSAPNLTNFLTNLKGDEEVMPLKHHIEPSLFCSTIISNQLEKLASQFGDFKKAILIVDEVSKASIIDLLRFATYAKKIILLGDDMQLLAINDPNLYTKKFLASLNKQELETYRFYFEESIFTKLFIPNFEQVLSLWNCYRSSQEIINLYNDLAYQGQVQGLAKSKKFEFISNSIFYPAWLKIYSQNNLVFVNHHYVSEKQNNLSEWELAKTHLEFLCDHLTNASQISLMVLTAYKKVQNYLRQKEKELIKKLKAKFQNFTFGTVDALQGQEADIVFFLTGFNKHFASYHNTYHSKGRNILQSLQRINVALSRAKSRLVMFGNYQLLSKIGFYDELAKKPINQTWTEILKAFAEGVIND